LSLQPFDQLIFFILGFRLWKRNKRQKLCIFSIIWGSVFFYSTYKVVRSFLTARPREVSFHAMIIEGVNFSTRFVQAVSIFWGISQPMHKNAKVGTK
jgi:hypothetical protein